jgi:S-formylglutathione hydrolase
LPILIDQGNQDKFYKEKQLLPEHFQKAAEKVGVETTVRFQDGYDHSYFFVSTFVGDHIAFHAKHLHA